MPTAKLTKRTIDALKPSDRDELIWDEDLRGYGLKVTPKGSKIYVVQYRMGGRGTSTRRYTIGRHGAWNPATARAEAERLLRLADSGADPLMMAKERERIEQDLSFRAFSDRFLIEFGRRNWRPRTYASAESNMRRWITPVLGRKALPSISRRDLTEIFDRLPVKSPALPRNIFALVRKLFAWAVERGDIERSPCEGMKSPPSVASRDRILTDTELRFITLCAGDLNPPFGALIRILILTGQRREEVAAMRWNELDQKQGEWLIPATRAKNKKANLLPLSEIAIVELDQLAVEKVWPRSGLVFTTNGRTSVSGFSRVKSRLDRVVSTAMGHPVTPWRLHDIRRTFATNMQKLGVRFEVTEALLNHISGARSGIAGVYQRHDWIDEKRDALKLWDGKLRRMLFDVPSA